MRDFNQVIRDAMEIWLEYWPLLHQLKPHDRLMLRRIDAHLRYIAEMLIEEES